MQELYRTQESQAITYARIVGLGAIVGMRSMSPPALLSRYLIKKQADASDLLSFLASPRTSQVLSVLALSEIAADKLPFAPNRTNPVALVGRIGNGALVGAALAQHQGANPWVGGVIGSAAALAWTLASFRLRLAAINELGVPNALAGVLEDSVVIGGSLALLPR